MTTRELLHQKTWRMIEHSELKTSLRALHSFAVDDALCTSVGGGHSPAVCRTWLHEDTVILGIQDTKLPYLEDGVSYLKQQGYDVIVRNSGGLAVVLDEGILNISLIFPDTSKKIGINDGYDAMWMFIQDMFKDFDVTIEAKEITGSYCPGSYDLSIHNKKFAGISQRRIRNGITVQIYLCVHGSGSQRAEVIRSFYETSLKEESTKVQYPKVQPQTMASLSELLNRPLQVTDMMDRLIATLQSYQSEIDFSELSPEEITLYHSSMLRIANRNEQFL